MICEKCKNELPDNSAFCLFCGEKISKPETTEEKKITEAIEEPTISKPKRNNWNTKIIIGIVSALIIIAGCICAFVFGRSFSNNSKAIASAAESVVKIYCYDYFDELAATGSGFIAFDDQTVVTNYHVISDAYTAKISTEQDITYTVESVICYSKEKDIAVLKLSEKTNLKVLPLGDSFNITKGEKVVAIGSPLGIKNTVSSGILSGRIMEDSMDVLQFSASISSGSSGGALFNDNGEVIGITYASYIEGQNLNLAIPINEVKTLYTRKNSISLENLFSEEHPYIKYIAEYENAIALSLVDLKDAPDSFEGKLVKINATISSIEYGQKTNSFFVCAPEKVTGFYDYDDNTYKTKSFEENSFLLLEDTWAKYCNDELTAGDDVTIIGYFHAAKFTFNLFEEQYYEIDFPKYYVNAYLIFK